MAGFIDIHCHILPGVDDGAPSQEVSRRMMAAARSVGVVGIVATPHVYDARDTLEGIAKAFAWFAHQARSAGVGAYLGYEVSFRVLADITLDGLQKLCVQGTNCLLLELPDAVPFPNWLDRLTQIARRFELVIVHPERCLYLADGSLARKLTQIGCELQVDAGALAEPFFHPERRAAAKLLKMGLAHYVASDAHCPRDYRALPEAIRALSAPEGKLVQALKGLTL